MKEECLICGAPLEYLETDVQMQCEICRKKELAKTRCVNGHYVCSDCHMQGLDTIIGLCMKETSRNPVVIIEKMMALPFCHMHGPEHHVMVGAALLTAYHNAGGDIALSDALMEMLRRGKSVPGGACGFWGCVRRGDQHGDVRLDHLQVNAADRRAVCAVAQNDGGRARADRRDRRPALLQARLVPVHSHGDRFCEGALRHRAAKAGGRVPLRRAEQSVHRKALPLQRGKPLSACRRTESGFSERPS